MSDSKDKEPDVLFVGDSLIQLMHQFGVKYLIHTTGSCLNCNVVSAFKLTYVENDSIDMERAVFTSSLPELWGRRRRNTTRSLATEQW